MKNANVQIKCCHEKAVEVVKRYKRSEIELIEVLEEVERLMVHHALGFSSLYRYTTDGLGLSPEVAYIFINVARKSKEVPALKEEIKKGTITVSKAKKISAVLTKQNQNHWLALAQTSSK